MDCLNCKHFPENGDTYYDCEFHYECINLGGVFEPQNQKKPYCEDDYEAAKKQGLDLDDWGDYCLYYDL